MPVPVLWFSLNASRTEMVSASYQDVREAQKSAVNWGGPCESLCNTFEFWNRLYRFWTFWTGHLTGTGSRFGCRSGARLTLNVTVWWEARSFLTACTQWVKYFYTVRLHRITHRRLVVEWNLKRCFAFRRIKKMFALLRWPHPVYSYADLATLMP